MSTLYPRLLPGAASELWKSLQQSGPEPPSAGSRPPLARATFAATGGRRITSDQLAGVRADLVRLARQTGMPVTANIAMRNAFDVSVARYLHERLDLTPGEASQRSIWTYLGLVLVPDLCAWRFPPNEERGYFEERFRCLDVSRHTLSRLWLRAHLLHDVKAIDPYELIGVLGESDMDQIITRRDDVAATRGVAQAVVRVHRDDLVKTEGVTSRDLLRDSLKRLRRLATFLDFDALDPPALLQLVKQQREESRRELAAKYRHDQGTEFDSPEAHVM